MLKAQDQLETILRLWTELTLERLALERQNISGAGLNQSQLAKLGTNARVLTRRMARQTLPYLGAFMGGHEGRTAEELEEIAGHLSPGGAHTSSLLVDLVSANLFFADPLMVAATVRRNWHGGKVGFQFLPDPAKTDLDDYRDVVADLIETVRSRHRRRSSPHPDRKRSSFL